MIRRRASTGANDRLILWLACVFALCAGCYIAFFRLSAAIDSQHELTAGVVSIVRANDRTLAARPELERTERRLDATLRKLDLGTDHATIVARFIRATAQIAAVHHTALEQIDERRSAAPDPRAAQRPADEVILEAIPLDITLSGSYRDLLATVRGLAQAPFASRIEVAAIERGPADDGTTSGTPLTARLGVTIERLIPAPPVTANP